MSDKDKYIRYVYRGVSRLGQCDNGLRLFVFQKYWRTTKMTLTQEKVSNVIEREYFEVNDRYYQKFINVQDANIAIKTYQKECYGVESDILHYLGSWLFFNKDYAKPKYKTIANEVGVSVSTIRRAIKRLVDKCIVVVEHDKKDGYRSNKYIIPTLADRKRIQRKRDEQARQYDNNFTNEHSTVNTRPNENEIVKPQRPQAIKYTRFIRKPKATLSLFTRPKDLKSTTSVNHSTKRIKPISVPDHVYYRCVPFFSDDEIKRIYQTVKNRLHFFKHVLDDNMTELIIDKALDSLLNAKRQYKADKRTQDVKNPIAYICTTAWNLAINFELGKDIDEYIKPVQHNGYKTLFA